jgi:hypothetical protein
MFVFVLKQDIFMSITKYFYLQIFTEQQLKAKNNIGKNET